MKKGGRKIKNFFKIHYNSKYGKIPTLKELYRSFWAVAWPASIEGVFINLILLADLIMVGKLGIAKAAAIGIVSQPKMIMQMFGKALGTGVTAVVSRRSGEKKYDELNSAIKQSMLITVIVYLVLVYVAITFKKQILTFMGANQEYIEYAMIYFSYLTIALFFKAISAILSSVQVAVGNTKVILKASVIGNITNLVLNYILIFGKFNFPRLEIKGAAIATVIGEAIICIILLLSILRSEDKENIDILNKGSFALSSKIMSPILNIGANSFFEHLFERIGLIIFARLIAELGTVAVGTHHYCIIIWDLYYYFGLGLGVASSSFSGRKLGEKRPDLAKIYTKVAQKSGFIISVVVATALVLFRNNLFASIISDQNVIVLGSSIMIVVAILIVPQTQAQVLTGSLRGAGDNRFIAIYSLFVSAILRPIVAYLFAFKFGYGLHGIWVALLVDEILKMVLSKYRISKGIWLQKEI